MNINNNIGIYVYKVKRGAMFVGAAHTIISAVRSKQII